MELINSETYFIERDGATGRETCSKNGYYIYLFKNLDNNLLNLFVGQHYIINIANIISKLGSRIDWAAYGIDLMQCVSNNLSLAFSRYLIYLEKRKKFQATQHPNNHKILLKNAHATVFKRIIIFCFELFLSSLFNKWINLFNGFSGATYCILI